MSTAVLPTGVPPVVVRRTLGVGLILLMTLCFAMLDTNAKFLGGVVPVIIVVWARYMVQAVVIGVWLALLQLRQRRNLFLTRHPRFQLLRGSLLLLSSVIVFYGLQFMPVGEFTAVGMLTPVIATLLAALLLKESLTPLRAALVVGGFIGAITVVRPGSGLFGIYALLPLTMALVYASFQLLTRKLSGLEHPLTTHFYTGLVGSAIVSIVLWFSPTDLLPSLAAASPSVWGLLLLAGVLGTAGHLCLVFALGMAPMAVLMPFTYVQIAFASMAGWVIFGHVPDSWAFAGMAIVAGCGAASVWLNLREASAAVPARNDAQTIAD
ncbi:DMT family transporter [Piscinibacter sakaiensis]|uniref:DMT family transporter n=1 Tax=Piscinibacter sakaiensis TaxID=1547922 RepID=UPI003AAB744D